MPKKHSLLDDLVVLPWWINLILAVIVYLALRFWVPTIEPQSLISKGLLLAAPGLALPFSGILVLVAVISAINSWRKGELLERQTGTDSIRALSWQEFEALVGEAYRRQGYSVEENHAAGPDGGIDLELHNASERLLVQCKNWRSRSVGVKVVRELFGLVAAEKATGGVVVCSGRFTRDAVAFAEGKPLTLVDGPALLRLVRGAQVATPPRPAESSPTCPKCGRPMVRRTARKGSHAGQQFWGCSAYPGCRGIRQIG